MDILSNLLSLLRPESHIAGRFDLGLRQSVQLPSYEGIKCYAVVNGRCWLALETSPPVNLERGDCFLLPGGQPFSLETEPGSAPVTLEALIQAMQKGLPGLYEGEPACTLVGAHFTFQTGATDLLLSNLPPLIHLQKSPKRAAMRWSLERMRDEIMQQQLGSSFLIQQLATCMLVEVLRAFLADAEPDAVGWLPAVTDPQLKAAILSMHSDPSRNWSLGTLAQHAGMSRSLFARKFKEKVGESPMDHLTRWRMLLAANRLTASEESVIEIAISLGYKSESAFGKALKRVTGRSPRQYKKQAKA